MRSDRAALPLQPDTIAEMRELYRSAEARSARMRLLSTSGQELAEADPDTISVRLQQCGDRLALFLGCRKAFVHEGDAGEGLVVMAPAPHRRVVARIAVEGILALDSIADPEDRDAVAMHLDLMGATIDRIERERERGDLLSTLREREMRLAEVVGKLFSAQEDERRRVSHELHDGVAQTATALVRVLEGAGTSADEPIPAPERHHLATVARELVHELRAVIGGLRPTLLDDLGLQAALQSLSEGLEAEGYRVSFDVAQGSPRLKPHIETALFRVAQEALTNIRKHSGGPCDVAIELVTESKSAAGYLRISDNGMGPGKQDDTQGAWTQGQHVGLDVMRERMAAIGGELDWQGRPNGGVTVIARLPKAI